MPCLLGQVVVDDDGVGAVVAEELAHGAAGIRRQVLHINKENIKNKTRHPSHSTIQTQPTCRGAESDEMEATMME
jgi:hypothetical protein